MYGRSMTEQRAWLPRLLLGLAALLPTAAGCGFHWVTGDGELGRISVCDEQGCDTPFLSPTSIVTLRVDVDEAPYGTRVSSRWYHVTVDPLRRHLIRERITDVDEPQPIVHRLEPPRTGRWKPGAYLIEVTLRDRLVARKVFHIAPPPPEPVSPPPVPPMPPEGKKDILDDGF
jgi:hypothetical protein